MHTIAQLKPWKAIQSGNLSRDELFARLAAARIDYSTWATDLLHWRYFAPNIEKRQVNFGLLTLGDLGLQPGDSSRMAVEHVAEMGIELDLFMPLYAFELALHYPEQPERECITILLSQMSQYAQMYIVGRDHGHHQSVRADQEYQPLQATDKFAFVLPT